MRFTSEIYLTKKCVTKEEWQCLIDEITNYNGFFRKWKIIITNNNNQIRYYVKTHCSLPPTINKLDSFLLKNINENIETPKYNIALPFYHKISNNIIDLINHFEIKNKGILECLELSFFKLYEDKIIVKENIFVNKNGKVTKYKSLLKVPSCILDVDYEGNKRYFYKKAPKYLDINKVLHLLNSDNKLPMLKVDTFPYLQGDFYLNQNAFNFAKHSVIMGSSGSGKSKFICTIINNIYNNPTLKTNYKIVVIDPHASLEDDIGGIGKVIDFKTLEDSMDLFINNNEDIVSNTEILMELFVSLLQDNYNSKLERVLRHSIHLLLTGKNFNFTNLRKLLLDLEYRNDLIRNYKNDLPVSVIDFFLKDFNDLKTKSYGEAISPIIAFIDEMEMIPVFNNQSTTANLINTLQDNFLTIFSLDRIKLGDKVTKTIAGLVMGQMLSLIQSHYLNEHIIFIIDEVSVVENPILARFLSEARKYNLSLVLAGQYFNQISDNLKNAIFANVINYYIFRVSKLDANLLADNFNMEVPLDNTKERKVKILSELSDRECIVRIDSGGILLPAFKGTTIDYHSIPRVKRENYDNKLFTPNPKNKETSSFKITDPKSINLKDLLVERK